MSASYVSHFLQYLLGQTSVLALSWWQRMLVVVPVCLLLWWSVMWALGGD